MSNQRSVSSILKSARLKKGINLDEISRSLRIHTRFLTALEEGDYSVFSSAVHLKGFLKNYAAFLDLNVEEILAFFRREYPEEKGLTLTDPVKPLGATVAVITPERAVSGFIVLLVVAFFGYLFFQYRNFANAPDLSVSQPSRDYKTSESVINVSGKTNKDVVLRINGQEINLAEDGSFATPITLLDGVNELKFVSKNKLGKERALTRTIILERIRPSEPAAEASPSALVSDSARLEISIGPNAAWLEVVGLSSKETLFQGLMVAGVSQVFSDPVGVKVRTGNGGSTRAVFNGRDVGQLGEEGEVVEKEFNRL